MRVLGAILAGGAARRFGSDKAVAVADGRTLVAHAIAALHACEAWVMCGRTGPWTCVEDRPRPGLGPLGGLCGALAHGQAHGFEMVLSIPCDVPDLPADLLARLGGTRPAYLEALPVAGLWRCALAPELERFLADGADRSMRAWAQRAGAAAVALERPVSNINTPADLAAYRNR